MATRYPQNYEYYPNHPWTSDTKPTSAEDDDMNVLDTNILEADPSHIISPTDHRRPSADTLSDRGNMWEQYRQDPMAQNRMSQQSTPFSGPSPFVRIDTAQAAAYAQQSNWAALNQSSASYTPSPAFEQMPQDFTPVSGLPYHGSVDFSHVSYPTESQPNSAVPMSPQSSQGWASAASSDTADTSRPVRSPTFRLGSPPTVQLQRDGIRKKNARFEIPAERTLSNIDNLIKISKDEHELKELKQQKRLLRNRQAALDSRQRKKMHTEKLEEEKKQFATVMNDLEDALADARRNEATLMQERAQWQAESQHLQQYIDNLHHERDEMIRVHTLETGDLRKRISIMREHLEHLERQAQYSQPAPDTAPGNVFTNDFSTFDNMGMDSQGWEDLTLPTSDFKMDTDPIKQEHTPVPQPQPEVSEPSKPSDNSKPAEVPFSWNAFYMCLLFGAFIASNSPPPSNTTSAANSNNALTHHSIPPLPSEYRAESANVLKVVLASARQPSRSNSPSSTLTSTDFARITAGPTSSSLGHLHNALSLPTRSQAEAAAFSLTPAQYAHLTNPAGDSDPFLSTSPPLSDTDADGEFDLDAGPAASSSAGGPEQGKQTELQRALAAMRGERDGMGTGAGGRNPLRGEVYERSLLWEMVPEKVVRDFREMVGRLEGEKSQHGGDE
ncbi:MAG: hypothetical protein Q9227_003591 [Pyrenula ochraceoflavens]